MLVTRSQHRRRGATLPLMAILLVVVMTLVAFSVDLGYVAVVRNELQNASDAAAHAATYELRRMENIRGELSGNLTSVVFNKAHSDAEAAAKSYVGLHDAGEVGIHKNGTSLKVRTDGITIGHLYNPSDHYWDESAGVFRRDVQSVSAPPPLNYNPRLLFDYYLPPAAYPYPYMLPAPVINDTNVPYETANSVKVVVNRRNRNNDNRRVPLFFSPILGKNEQRFPPIPNPERVTSAVASYEDYVIGFQVTDTQQSWLVDPKSTGGKKTSKLLPFTMDVNTFATMASGLSVIDVYKYNHTSSPTYGGADGTPNYKGRVTLATPTFDPKQVLEDPNYVFSGGREKLDPRHGKFDPYDMTIYTGLLPGDGIKEAVLVPMVVTYDLPLPEPPLTVTIYVDELDPITGLPVLDLLTGLPVQVPKEITFYAPKKVSAGNFGALYIGTKTRTLLGELDLTEFERQIKEGPDAADVGKLVLGTNGTLRMQGDYLVNTALKQALEAIKGQPRVIPLFRPTAVTPITEQQDLEQYGTDAEYEIVGFGGITILEVAEYTIGDVDGDGVEDDIPVVRTALGSMWGKKSLRLLVQPEFVIDPSALGLPPPDSAGYIDYQSMLAKPSRFVYRPMAITRGAPPPVPP